MRNGIIVLLAFIGSLGIAQSKDTSAEARAWIGKYQVDERSSVNCGKPGSSLIISEQKNEAGPRSDFAGLIKLQVSSQPIPTFMLDFFSGNIDYIFKPEVGDAGLEKEVTQFRFSGDKMSRDYSRVTWGFVRIGSYSAHFTRHQDGSLLFEGHLSDNGPDTGKMKCYFARVKSADDEIK